MIAPIGSAREPRDGGNAARSRQRSRFSPERTARVDATRLLPQSETSATPPRQIDWIAQREPSHVDCVPCAATAAVPAAAPRFAGLRRVAGPAALNRDVEQPSAVTALPGERGVPCDMKAPNRANPLRSIQRIGKYPGRGVSRKQGDFPRSRGADRAPRCAAPGGTSRPSVPSIAVDRFLAFHLIESSRSGPFSPRDHVLTSLSEPRSRPPPRIGFREVQLLGPPGDASPRWPAPAASWSAATGECNGNTASIQKLVQDLNAGEITRRRGGYLRSPRHLPAPRWQSTLDRKYQLSRCGTAGSARAALARARSQRRSASWITTSPGSSSATRSAAPSSASPAEFLGQKVASYAISKGLSVMACIGETLEERKSAAIP